MTIVVSDTSPIRAFAHLELLPLLQDLYRRIIVPQAVAVELSRAPLGQVVVGPDKLAELTFVEVRAVEPGMSLSRLLEELDRGESEALALALDLGADLVLMDERAGRSAAKREGLQVIGTLGVLLDAKRRGLIQSVEPLLDELQNNGQFFIGGPLREQILRAAGESGSARPGS